MKLNSEFCSMPTKCSLSKRETESFRSKNYETKCFEIVWRWCWQFSIWKYGGKWWKIKRKDKNHYLQCPVPMIYSLILNFKCTIHKHPCSVLSECFAYATIDENDLFSFIQFCARFSFSFQFYFLFSISNGFVCSVRCRFASLKIDQRVFFILIECKWMEEIDLIDAILYFICEMWIEFHFRRIFLWIWKC